MTKQECSIVERAVAARQYHAQQIRLGSPTLNDCQCPSCKPELYPSNIEELEHENEAMNDISGDPKDPAEHAS